jgi:hypothetical protein
VVVEKLVVDLVGGWKGGEREGEKMAGKKWGGGGWFFVIFRPYFLHAQAMKSTPIYKGWKRVILSTREKTFGP